MHAVQRYESEQKIVEIYVDECPENPRDEMETVSTLWCWHRRYCLGSKKEAKERGLNPSDYSGWDELRAAIEKRVKPVMLLPVFMYEHGDVALSTEPFSCPWDSGQVGFIFAQRNRLKDFGAKIATKKVRASIEKALLSELQTYEAYINGEVFAYRVLEGGVVTDSCAGYYGADEIPYMLQCALGTEAAKSAVRVK